MTSIFPTAELALSFKAGKMNLKGITLTADPRKGQVKLEHSDDLLHFTWRDRGTQTLEEDLIIFPGDAVFSKIASPTGSVAYVLKFLSSDKKLFFWSQEANEDNELCSKVNNIINGDLISPTNSNQEALLNLLRQNDATTAASPTFKSLSDAISSIEDPVTHMNALPEGALKLLLTFDNLEPLMKNLGLRKQIFGFLSDNFVLTSENLNLLISNPNFIPRIQGLHVALVKNVVRGFMNELRIDPAVNGPFGGLDVFLNALKRK